MIEGDVEAFKILRAFGGDAADQLPGRDAFALGLEHDGRAMRVVGADEMHLVALHALKPHPDVGLDVFHDVADMERPVGIGQGGGDEQLARHGQCASTAERPRFYQGHRSRAVVTLDLRSFTNPLDSGPRRNDE